MFLRYYYRLDVLGGAVIHRRCLTDVDRKRMERADPRSRNQKTTHVIVPSAVNKLNRERGSHSYSKDTRWSVITDKNIPAMQYNMKSDLLRSDHRTLLFDTHAMVNVFKENGFTTQQAEVLVQMLINITNSNMGLMYSDMVTKTQQEIMLQGVMSHIAAVKKDMIILEKSEFSELLEENDRIKVEVAQLKTRLSDVMNKVSLDNKMDMNLEKIQVKEMKAEHEKKILETRTHIMEMCAEQGHHSTKNNVKIDMEVAGLKTLLETHKLDSIKYLAGSIFTCLTVVLGFYRLWI